MYYYLPYCHSLPNTLAWTRWAVATERFEQPRLLADFLVVQLSQSKEKGAGYVSYIWAKPRLSSYFYPQTLQSCFTHRTTSPAALNETILETILMRLLHHERAVSLQYWAAPALFVTIPNRSWRRPTHSPCL
ncbi:hypothetical protein CY34DRAFT_273912 [Suillus luteus UH-Slu-Lm8-n1]|uniref:Uncharacterized protein n=1 Tax=Suillus luteus UH-Slu-Lm8-n1 TaxID=930992 RepID=A0A0C9ZRF9_9AGAM|nr:hypothetical protein CY34DRAFT_273912 [Suillus luteus UH-Slu-Lm8-n1]